MSNFTGIIVADRYKIKHLINKGGQGELYEISDKHSSSKLCIKLMPVTNDVYEEPKKIFHDLMEKVIKVDHPNFVKFFTYGEVILENKEYFYCVMEYLEGTSLREILKKNGSLPLEKAIEIFAQLADAVDSLHKCDVIHRDIKPDNIVIEKDDKTGKEIPKLVDIDIAKANANSNDTHSTYIGTPKYMSPEQRQCKPIDFKSDLYSLGATLYETLTGNQPDEQRLDDANQVIPKNILTVLEDCMAKNPNNRPGSAKDFINKIKEENAKKSLKSKLSNLQQQFREFFLSSIPELKKWKRNVVLVMGTILVIALMHGFVSSPEKATGGVEQSQKIPFSDASSIDGVQTKEPLKDKEAANGRSNPSIIPKNADGLAGNNKTKEAKPDTNTSGTDVGKDSVKPDINGINDVSNKNQNDIGTKGGLPGLLIEIWIQPADKREEAEILYNQRELRLVDREKLFTGENFRLRLSSLNDNYVFIFSKEDKHIKMAYPQYEDTKGRNVVKDAKFIPSVPKPFLFSGEASTETLYIIASPQNLEKEVVSDLAKRLETESLEAKKIKPGQYLFSNYKQINYKGSNYNILLGKISIDHIAKKS